MSHTSTGTVDRCNYLAIVQYQAGIAHVAVGLVYEDGAPKLVQLNINSDAFLN